MTTENLARIFGYTFLKSCTTKDDFKRLCNEAKSMGAAIVAINSEPVRLCKELLKESQVHVGVAISFPLGQITSSIKLAKTRQAIPDGADEINYVINTGKVKMHDWEYLKKEMQEIMTLCHENNVTCKVIFENRYSD